VRRTRTGLALFRAVVVTVGVVIGATAASKARAGDYLVGYAIDARGLRETGKNAECIYEKACRLKFERTSIRILVNADRGQKHHLVSIHDSTNCCYFADDDLA
jgi:hypothetical protein